ncbi:MAG: class 3 adenylate cyclase [Granulosicoccus sp.]
MAEKQNKTSDSRDISTATKGQNRQVTILFSDISGSTTLSADIGSEETHLLLQAYFEIADEIVRVHGGIVDKYIGDSVMAVFGVLVAYGNEAQRAMNAAFAIQASMPQICVLCVLKKLLSSLPLSWIHPKSLQNYVLSDLQETLFF